METREGRERDIPRTAERGHGGHVRYRGDLGIGDFTISAAVSGQLVGDERHEREMERSEGQDQAR